ncbi:hypothetical protein J2S30_005284 [Herbaspirillum rubrisubalbicans]|uniref:MchS3 family protein n=1 Tax=Herbaspirillum rubrisubalbicans TaxID=80842 RepID=UPI00209DBE27|nr:MchS3 family protein [Herbaspirillum rubrisubalbicans]MCP1576905.1 hypothetical protein [Herbaspirillum rubrisubalbicans]
MKTKLPLTLSCSLLMLASAVSTRAAEAMVDDYIQLRQTPTFALGQVGFIGHISESEQRYRRILQTPEAMENFQRLLDDEAATKEGRLYAACAIRTLAPGQFEDGTSKLRAAGGTVSVLRADILRREPVQEHLQRIAQQGCNEAYWR